MMKMIYAYAVSQTSSFVGQNCRIYFIFYRIACVCACMRVCVYESEREREREREKNTRFSLLCILLATVTCDNFLLFNAKNEVSMK